MAPLLVMQVAVQKAPLLVSVIFVMSAVDYRSMDLDNFISPILYVPRQSTTKVFILVYRVKQV